MGASLKIVHIKKGVPFNRYTVGYTHVSYVDVFVWKMEMVMWWFIWTFIDESSLDRSWKGASWKLQKQALWVIFYWISFVCENVGIGSGYFISTMTCYFPKFDSDVSLGLRLLARVKPSEIFLKSISKEVTKVEVTFPSRFVSLYLLLVNLFDVRFIPISIYALHSPFLNSICRVPFEVCGVSRVANLFG